MRTRPLLPFLLAALAGCASPEGKPPAATGEPSAAPGAGASGAEGDPALLVGTGKAALYRDVEILSRQWEIRNAEPGESAAREARALEGAIAREVMRDLDGVIADLGEGSNPRWRRAAAKGLGFVRNPRVRPALEKALGDRDPWILASVLVSLGRIADPEIPVERVAALLAFPDPVVAGNAALVLARTFQARRDRGQPAVASEKAGREIEADLLVRLLDPADPVVRGNAAQALGMLATPGAEDALLNGLGDDHPFVRLKAAAALARAGTTRSYPALLDALRVADGENMRLVAALALGAIAERQGMQPSYTELGTDAVKWRRWLGR